MATQTLNTRIALKSDTTANWAKSTLVLLKGEQAIEITESGAYKIKIGDGVKTFAELPYATMTPEEISALIGDGSVQNVTLASGTNNGTLKLTVDGTTTDNIAVKGLGSAAYTNTSAYATAAQGALATNAVRKVVSGTANGTISVTTGTGAATDIAVKGLGSAAYKGAGASQGQVPVNGAALGTTANVPVVTNTSGQLVPHASGALGSAAFKGAETFATAAQGAKADKSVQSVSITSGTNNGTIKLTVNGNATDNIAVKGLGSAAYTASGAYATSAQGAKADAAMPKAGGTFTGTVTLAADPTDALQPTTKQYVDAKISSSIAASDAMVFKGTLGTNGTATALPTSSVVIGDTYKVITQVSVVADNSYTGAAVTAKVGDLVVAMSKDPKWIVVPSGDEIVTTVKYSTTTQNLTTSAKSGEITVGEAATKQVDSSIAAASTSTKLPTSKAVAAFVEGKGYKTTDQKVKNTLNTTAKAYVTGTTSATTGIGEQVFDTGVYLDTTAGKLVATTFAGALQGNATTATSAAACTGNAASAIAFRNAVLKVIPKAVTKKVIANVKQVALGQSIDLETSRKRVIDYFSKIGVTQEQLLDHIEVKDVDQIDKENILYLRSLANAIKEGTTSVKETFGNKFEADKIEEFDPNTLKTESDVKEALLKGQITKEQSDKLISELRPKDLFSNGSTEEQSAK